MNCDRCGKPNATVERVQSGSHWHFHPECELPPAPPPSAPRGTRDARAPISDIFAGMNKLEKRRAIELEALKRSGVIQAWWYERFTFKLADDTRYTPDFAYQTSDGTIQLEETKGFWREDAKIKCKLCAELYPFPLRALVWDTRSNSWDITVFR